MGVTSTGPLDNSETNGGSDGPWGVGEDLQGVCPLGGSEHQTRGWHAANYQKSGGYFLRCVPCW